MRTRGRGVKHLTLIQLSKNKQKKEVNIKKVKNQCLEQPFHSNGLLAFVRCMSVKLHERSKHLYSVFPNQKVNASEDLEPFLHRFFEASQNWNFKISAKRKHTSILKSRK